MHHDEEKKLEHAVKGGGEIVHNHIVKWYGQWLQGAGSDAETERRLEIMLEEVAIGEVLCFGAGQEMLGRCSTPILSGTSDLPITGIRADFVHSVQRPFCHPYSIPATLHHPWNLGRPLAAAVPRESSPASPDIPFYNHYLVRLSWPRPAPYPPVLRRHLFKPLRASPAAARKHDSRVGPRSCALARRGLLRGRQPVDADLGRHDGASLHTPLQVADGARVLAGKYGS